jgi:hypothetical protein
MRETVRQADRFDMHIAARKQERDCHVVIDASIGVDN